jgi:hypothetical protein
MHDECAYNGVMPAKAEQTPGDFANAVANAITREMQSAKMSARELAIRTNHSNGYISKRLRHEAAFTLTDVDAIAKAIGFNAAKLVGSIHLPGEMGYKESEVEETQNVASFQWQYGTAAGVVGLAAAAISSHPEMWMV